MSNLALVAKATNTVVMLVADSGRLEIPGTKITVSPPQAGWETEDHILLPLERFSAPEGFQRIGSPSYVVGETVVERYEVEAIPQEVETIFKADIWRRCTDDEAVALDGALKNASVRLQWLWRDAQYLRSDDELFPIILHTAIGLFGDVRAAAILFGGN
jgi:hypothetical protein